MRLPYSDTPTFFVYKFYLSIKYLGILNKFSLLQNLHLYTQKSFCATSTRPFGEVGRMSPLHLSSEHILLKIEVNKKLLQKNLVLKTYQLELKHFDWIAINNFENLKPFLLHVCMCFTFPTEDIYTFCFSIIRWIIPYSIRFARLLETLEDNEA